MCRRAQTRPWLEKVHRGVCREFEGKKGILRGNQGKRRSEKGGSRPFLLISVPLEGLRSRASCSPHFSPGGCCFTLFDFFKIYPCRFLAKSLSGRNLRPGNNTAERVCKRGARGMQGPGGGGPERKGRMVTVRERTCIPGTFAGFFST